MHHFFGTWAAPLSNSINHPGKPVVSLPSAYVVSITQLLRRTMIKRSLLFSVAATIIAWIALSNAANAHGIDSRQAMQLGKAAYGGNPTALAELKALAQTGSVAAETILGALYQSGSSVNRDDAEALKWFLKAAEQGDMEAQFGLGVMYANGFGTKQDYAAAARWFKKAAAQGNTAPNFYLGLLYENGLGAPKNYAEAAKWYTKAASAPKSVGLQFALSMGAGKGLHAPEDNSQVIKVFPMVLDQALASAAYNLGMMCWNGRGAPENDVDAYKWFAVAASNGNHLAEYNMRILARQMSQKQIADAMASVASWAKVHPPRNADKLSSR